MKKLIFILFMLPMLAVCQQHGMFALASQESSEWNYEGIMTVGDGSYVDGGITYNIFGYSLGDHGSMNPTNPQVSGFPESTTIVCTYYDDGGGMVYELAVFNFSSGINSSCNTIEIDGVEFSGFETNTYIYIESNPFPATGQTCTIKMK